jgi:hypothetical protein
MQRAVAWCRSKARPRWRGSTPRLLLPWGLDGLTASPGPCASSLQAARRCFLAGRFQLRERQARSRCAAQGAPTFNAGAVALGAAPRPDPASRPALPRLRRPITSPHTPDRRPAPAPRSGSALQDVGALGEGSSRRPPAAAARCPPAPCPSAQERPARPLRRGSERRPRPDGRRARRSRAIADATRARPADRGHRAAVAHEGVQRRAPLLLLHHRRHRLRHHPRAAGGGRAPRPRHRRVQAWQAWQAGRPAALHAPHDEAARPTRPGAPVPQAS